MTLSPDLKKGICIVVLILAGAGLTVLFMGFGLASLLQAKADEVITLPVLAIIGVLVLLACLAIVSVAFAAFNLSDKTQALALPEGSVRAVIALCLLVLFSIISIFLFSSLSDPITRSVSGIYTAKEMDDFLKLNREQLASVVVMPLPPTAAAKTTDAAKVADTGQKAGDAKTSEAGKKDEVQQPEKQYKIVYRAKPDEDAKARQRAKEDFAKQLLVLIGTLVTAVASFYFGTRAVAGQAETRVAGTLASVTPPAVPAGSGTTEFTISGNNLDLVREVKLVSGSDELIGVDVSSNAQAVKFKTAFGEKAKPKSQWDVVATDANQRILKLQGAIKVTDGAAAAPANVLRLDPSAASLNSWPSKFTISGSNLDKTRKVNVRQESSSTPVEGRIKATVKPTELTFEVDASKLSPGSWNVELVDDADKVLVTLPLPVTT